jgi:hypothetical protein
MAARYARGVPNLVFCLALLYPELRVCRSPSDALFLFEVNKSENRLKTTIK